MARRGEIIDRANFALKNIRMLRLEWNARAFIAARLAPKLLFVF